MNHLRRYIFRIYRLPFLLLHFTQLFLPLLVFGYTTSGTFLKMTFYSYHSLESLDLDLTNDDKPPPRYSSLPRSLLSEISSKMALDTRTITLDWLHFILIPVCLIAGLASMPFVDLCSGGGALAGTLALSTGIGLLFQKYWTQDLFSNHAAPDDNGNPRWHNNRFWHILLFILPFGFALVFSVVLLVIISNCCKTAPINCEC